MEADAQSRRRGAQDRRARRLARLLAPPLPAPALDLRAGALPAPAVSRRRLGRRGDPRPGGLRAARHPSSGSPAPASSCAGRCSSRSAGSTRASSTTARTSTSAPGSGRRATRCATCRTPSPSTRAARRRPGAGLLPILAASRIRYADKHDCRLVALARPRRRRARLGDARGRLAGRLAGPPRPPARARRGADAAPGRP